MAVFADVDWTGVPGDDAKLVDDVATALCCGIDIKGKTVATTGTTELVVVAGVAEGIVVAVWLGLTGEAIAPLSD